MSAVRRIIALATKGEPVEGCETTPLDLKDDTQRRVALQARIFCAGVRNISSYDMKRAMCASADYCE